MNIQRCLIVCFLVVMAGMVVTQCNDDDDDDLPSNIPRAGLIACTDYVSGTLSILDLDEENVVNDVESVSSDPAVKVSGTQMYIINRYLCDNIQILDWYNGFKTKIQFSTGNGSNPQDIESIDYDRVYISRFEPPFNDILIANPGTGEHIRGALIDVRR